MASPHTTSQPAFLVFPTLSPEYLWRVVATETNRTISRHKNLETAYEKAEQLNRRSLESLNPAMPDPVYATFDDHRWIFLRQHCQQELGQSGSAETFPCYRPASISDVETSLSFCVECWKESL
jgi:hypothetical protein